MNAQEKQENNRKRARRILDIAKDMANKTGNNSVINRIEEIELHYNGYAEPRYDDNGAGVVALGNWNTIHSYNRTDHHMDLISDLPMRVGKLFEKMGIECEWNDEWICCDDCGKLVRTEGDSYSWKKSFHTDSDGNNMCVECIVDNAVIYLYDLEDRFDIANTIDSIDPAEHEYVKVNEQSFAQGWYPGQNDLPGKIAKELRAKGIHRYLFNIDSVGQFDMHFSVYVHMDEKHLLNDKDNVENDSSNNDCEDCAGECSQCSLFIDAEKDVQPTAKSFNRMSDSLKKIEDNLASNKIVNKNDCTCKVCQTALNKGESSCWKCGTNNPTS